jgi:peptide/nickel transport system substrate-binding protein
VPYMWSWQLMHIIPEHILSKVPDINAAPFNTNPIGTGPFSFHERVPGSHILFKKNPEYHRGAPKLEQFIYKVVPDQNVLYTQFRTGDIDVIGLLGIPEERYEGAKKLPERELYHHDGQSVEFITFNCGNPQFKDPRVRHALSLAIDKERVTRDIYYGTKSRTLSYLPPDHWAYNSELKDPGYNPREAAQLLDEAGWKVGPDGIREKGGIKLKFTNSTTAGSKGREQAQVLIQQNWKEINVAMEIRNFPASVLFGEYQWQSKFETLMSGFGPLVGLDPDFTARLHSKHIPVKHGSGANYCQFENPEMDRLLEDGAVTHDPVKRKDIYWKVQRIIFDEVPFIPIFNWSYIYGHKSGLKGYKVNSYTKEQNWNVQEWTWE